MVLVRGVTGKRYGLAGIAGVLVRAGCDVCPEAAVFVGAGVLEFGPPEGESGTVDGGTGDGGTVDGGTDIVFGAWGWAAVVWSGGPASS